MTKEVLFESDYEGEEEDCTEWTSAVQLTRTMAHIIDYKMFIAARLIQTFWRAYRDRKRRNQRWQGCITIQRWWRGFRLRRQQKDLVEQRVQNAYFEYLNRMSIRIQACFRGWSERRNIHDMVRLTRVQTAATEDVLICLIQRLHHLKRTEHIPGFVSLQQTECVLKIEHLISTMAFRFFNGRLTSMVSRKEARQEEARRHFRDCRFQTDIPYSGFEFDLCTKQPYSSDVNVGNELLDPEFNDIATAYEAYQRSKYFKKWHSQKIDTVREREKKAKADFCKSVMSSMRGWAVWKELNVGIKDILANPESRHRFFHKLSIVLEELNVNCNCMDRVFPIYHCPEPSNYSGRDG